MQKKTIIIIASIAAVLALIPIGYFTLFRATPEYGHTPTIAEATEPTTAATIPPTPDTDTAVTAVATAEIAPSALGQISIMPLSADNGHLGVARDSGFLISSDTQTLTAEHLRTYITSSNGQNFLIEPQQGGSFLLRFEELLAPAQIYNLIYSPTGMQPTSHAFQTADIFRVVSTTPANSTHNTPSDSGIEVTFTQEVDERDFEAAFVIDPPVEGRFLRRDNTFIFAPNELAFNTTYTVTIKDSLTSATGETLAESHTFMFTTQWGTARGAAFSLPGSAYQTFLPWDEISIGLNVRYDFPYDDFIVRLYDLQTPENFINFTSPGELLYVFDLALETFPGAHREFHYLFLAQTLPEGYYLAEITSPNDRDGITLQMFIQVSALSVYSLSISGETVFWVHDATTHQPAARAQINIDGTSAITDADGIAIVATGQSARAAVTVQYGNYLPFAYTKRTFAPTNLTPSGRFLTYMQTDRPTYRPNDTVDIFGVIMPRYGQTHSAEDVITIRFGDMFELPVTLDNFYAFNKRVPITNMFGHMDIVVAINGERIMSSWVEFVDYTNLSFVMEGSLDRNAYFSNEYSQVEISVANFAGTPIDGIRLTSGDVTLTTNNYGIAQGAIRVPSHSESWQPHTSSHWLSVASDGQSSQHISLPFIVAPRDIMLEFEQITDGAITITTSHVTLDRLNAATSLDGLLSDNDIFRGELVDIDFSIQITRSVTTRTLTTRDYDHINRRTVATYTFDTVQTELSPILGRTQNGRALVDNLPYSDDPLIHYHIVIQHFDSRGMRTTTHIWRPWHDPHITASHIRHFGLRMENRAYTPTNDWGWGWAAPRNLGANQTGNVVLLESTDPWQFHWGSFENASTPTSGQMLAVLVRDGVLSATVGSPAGTPVTFPEEAISSALLFGAFFEQGYIFSVQNPITVHYDYMERALQIDFTFDQEQYAPEDEVTVNIQTTDAQGNPVPARVSLSVVDETAIMRRWHEDTFAPNFLSSLYRSSAAEFWNFPFTQFTSHIQSNFDTAGGGAEGGGGGDGGQGITFRDWFVDNPIFEVVQTNASGSGSFTFTLPHQVTSWRVTALGLTDGGFAGDGRYNIISTLPFFIDLLLTNEYIVGDDIAAVASVFADSALSSTAFTFEVLSGDTVVGTYTTTAVRRAEFNAGKLAAGDYTMRVIATMGNHTDAMELPFTVVETGMILPIRTMQQISPDSATLREFDMRSLPVQVTFTNGNIRELASIMHGALDSTSFRTDVMAATAFVGHFHGWHDEAYDFADVRSRIHARSGGIPELIYEYEDFYYTARFTASFPEFVNRDQIIRYVRNETEGQYLERHAAGLLALAAIGEPVLTEIYQHIDSLRPINETNIRMEVLYLAAALVAAGDDAGAYSIMQQLDTTPWTSASDMRREMADTLKLFINTAINPQAALAHLNRPHGNRYISDIPERIHFVRRAIILGENISEVEFYLNGEVQTLRLENFERRTLRITPEQFDNLNLSPVSGVTDFFVQFYGYNSDNWADGDNRIDITRSISLDGELYRIDLRATLPLGYFGSFTIYDRLPSNLRFVPIPQRGRGRGEWFRVQNTQRQLVEITFFQCQESSSTRTFTYHAMQLFEGDMANDTTYISNNNARNHIWGRTE